MLSPSQLGIPRIEPAKRIVQVGVVGEQLPVGEQRPTDVRARDHSLTDAEERPLGAVGIENMGDGQRRIGIGAIVKGDRHFGPISRPVRDHRPEPGDRRRVGANPGAEEQHGRQAGDGHEPARPAGIGLRVSPQHAVRHHQGESGQRSPGPRRVGAGQRPRSRPARDGAGESEQQRRIIESRTSVRGRPGQGHAKSQQCGEKPIDRTLASL